MLHQSSPVIFIKPETNWYMVYSDFHFQFVAFNTTVELYTTQISDIFELYIRFIDDEELILNEAEAEPNTKS